MMSSFRQRAGGYMRDAGGVNLEKVLVYGALAFGAFTAWRVYRAARDAADAARNAAAAAGGAIGGKLADWFQKAPGDVKLYAVRLPEAGTVTGNVGINAASISTDGVFVYKGQRYRIRVDKSQVPDKIAVKV
jgi:hypothetical protein